MDKAKVDSNRVDLIYSRLHAQMLPFKIKKEIGEFSQDKIILASY